LSESLAGLSRREGSTLFMTLLAAFQILLHRYSGQEDIVVGSPIAGRNQVETEGLIGFFVNTLVLRTQLSGEMTFREVLARVKDTALGAYAHQDLPFEKLVEELNPIRQVSHTPLFQVMFGLQNAPRETLAMSNLVIARMATSSQTAKFDLTLHMLESDDGLAGWIEYNTDLFNLDTIERMGRHFGVLLSGAVANPNSPIASLPLLTQEEQQQMVKWNETGLVFSTSQCVHHLFEAQVEKTPDAIARTKFQGQSNSSLSAKVGSKR
jgi:non-ribosomal peptide synthetase component F